MANPNSNQSTTASRSLHGAVSVAGSRLQEAVSNRATGLTNLRTSWDSLVRIAFAPCAGDIGGIPREEVVGQEDGGSNARGNLGPSSPGGRGKTNPNTSSWGASVPFEVSASQSLTSSFQARESSLASMPQQFQQQGGYPTQEQRPLGPTPREMRKAKSRAKLRQLGAQHQLATGFHGETLADTARPTEDEHEAQHESPELVDFDDGISAISSHTLEDMERRRQVRALNMQRLQNQNVVRLRSSDFHQVIDENAALTESPGLSTVFAEDEDTHDGTNTEVVFGEPFYEAEEGLYKNVRTVVDDGNGVAHDEFVPASFNRTRSDKTNQTQNTTITDDSHEFEEMYKRHEAMYWVDQDEVAITEKSARSRSRTATRASQAQQRMSIEERARRLRELSRSRSRSDGTGSTNISGTSSLVSGQHPHDTVPVYPSDLFTRRKKSGSSKNGRSRKSSERNLIAGSSSDPFSSLDYGEI